MVVERVSTFNLMHDFFTLLGLKRTFQLDESELHKAYMTVQQLCHPDRMVGKSSMERNTAIQRSMDANEAYEALKSPLLRAQHLLALQGIVVNADGPASVKPDQSLLIEMMELREQLSEAADEASIAQASFDIKNAMKQCSAELEQAFAEEAYEQAAQLTIRLRYLGKALEEAMARHYQIKAAS